MRVNVYPTAKPEDFLVSSDAIKETISDIRKKNGLDLHSFLLLRKGTLLWEEYFRPNEKDHLHVLFSVTKSFMSTAIGMAQDQGLLSIDDKVSKYFPEYADLFDSTYKKELTLKHLLMMGIILEHDEGEIFKDNILAGDLAKATLESPLAYMPGEKFSYCSLASHLLSCAFNKVCPEGLHDYLKRKLFAPMNITRSQWNVDSRSIDLGGFGLYLSAYDMTKLGQLYLQEGMWEGQQLLSKSYAKEATSYIIDNQVDKSEDRHFWSSGYGYQFWQNTNTLGGYRADGMRGQFIIVLPEQEVVIVMTADLEEMHIPMDAVRDHLLLNIL